MKGTGSIFQKYSGNGEGEGVETGFLPEVSQSWKCDVQCDDVVNNTVSHV